MTEVEIRQAFRNSIIGTWKSQEYFDPSTNKNCRYLFSIQPTFLVTNERISVTASKQFEDNTVENENIGFLWVGETLVTITNNFYFLKVERAQNELKFTKINPSISGRFNAGDTVISFEKL